MLENSFSSMFKSYCLKSLFINAQSICLKMYFIDVQNITLENAYSSVPKMFENFYLSMLKIYGLKMSTHQSSKHNA